MIEYFSQVDWGLVIGIFGVLGGIATIFGLFLGPMFYLGSKMNAMSMSLNAKIDNVSTSLNAKIDGVNASLTGKIDDLRRDMHADMKDFHGRLCAIEERRGRR